MNDFTDSHGLLSPPKPAAEDAVAIAKRAARNLVKREGLPKLPGGPLNCGTSGDNEVEYPTVHAGQHREQICYLVADRRNREEVP